MKFWLDWRAHRTALLICGAGGGFIGLIVLMSILPPWTTVVALCSTVALVLYAVVYAAAKSDLDPHKDSGRH